MIKQTRFPSVLLNAILFFMLLSVPVLAASPAGMAPSSPVISVAITPILKNAPELARLVRHWDNQSILAIEVARQAPRQVLNRADMSRTRIENDIGRKIELDKLFDTTFIGHRVLSEQLSRIPFTALVGKPQVNEAVVEFPDRLLMVRQARVVIRDPKQAASASQELAKFLSRVDMNAVSQARVDRLKPDEQESFRRYIKEELPLLDADDPLRKAMEEGGEDEVLRAILSGVGEFEVTDQVVVERRLFNDGGQRLSKEFRPLIQQRPFTLELPPVRPVGTMGPKNKRELSTFAGRSERGRQYEYPQGEQSEGKREFSESFLAGYTLGQEIAWERKWKFSGGFLRISYGIGYGIGLRIPIALNGRIEPVRTVRSAIDDLGRNVMLSVSPVVKDGLEADYKRAGLSPSSLFGGDEFVFTAGSWLSFKLYALGKNWAELSPINTPWNKNQSFTPPLGGSPRPFFTFAVPPELTNTVISAGALKGALQVGLGMNGTGTLTIPYALLLDGHPILEQRMVLASANSHTETLRLPPVTAQPGTVVKQSYGVRIDAPYYLMQVSAATRLRVLLEVSAGELKRSIATDWFDVFVLPLGQIILPPHAGTHTHYQWNEGVRIFEARDPGDPATMQKPRNIPKLSK